MKLFVRWHVNVKSVCMTLLQNAIIYVFMGAPKSFTQILEVSWNVGVSITGFYLIVLWYFRFCAILKGHGNAAPVALPSFHFTREPIQVEKTTTEIFDSIWNKMGVRSFSGLSSQSLCVHLLFRSLMKDTGLMAFPVLAKAWMMWFCITQIMQKPDWWPETVQQSQSSSLKFSAAVIWLVNNTTCHLDLFKID